MRSYGIAVWPVFGLLILWCFPARAEPPALEGYFSIEPRIFLDDPQFPDQPAAGLSASAVFAPEWVVEWDDGADRLTVSPFVRFDADDDERSHADLREMLWQRARGPWTIRVGVGRVFWGVTESRHLVDIINQTDQVEDLDDEDKLGQPLVSAEYWSSKAGSFSVWMLPGFRERTFPAKDARLMGAIPVDADRAEYQSSARSRHVDWALRWSDSVGGWDLGASLFRGTSREPVLEPRLGSEGQVVLVPRYDVVTQLGVEFQHTSDALLWKLESVYRLGHGTTFGALVAGFEYTFFDIGASGADVGVLSELHYDSRNELAPQTIFDRDWFIGMRVGLNDVQGTQLLVGAILDDDGTLAVVEGERRIGNNWKVEAELRVFADIDMDNTMIFGFRDDSFLTLRLARFF